MKRVIMFDGCGSRSVLSLNSFLTKHPNIELLDVRAVVDDLDNIVLVGTVNVPDDLKGLEPRALEYFGFEPDGEYEPDEEEED